MARWWPFARVQHRAVSELALAAEQGRERNGRDRQGQTLVVTRWEDGTEVIFGMASMVVHVGKVDEDDEVDEKIPRLDTTCEKDVDDKFFDACEEQVIELGLPHEPSPALPPVVIVLTPPGDEEPVRSPAQDAPPSPESSRLPAPPARKHEDVFIAIFEKELAKVFAGRTQADGPHAAAAAPTPPAPDASRAPDGALEPGWTWPLLVRGVMVLLAMGMAWTTFLLIGLWNCYTAS